MGEVAHAPPHTANLHPSINQEFCTECKDQD